MQPAVVLLFAAVLALAGAQMTFSDGWGKRSSPLSAFQQAGEEGEVGANPELDKCNVDYSQSLVQLHHRIMKLYDSYEQCQHKALGGAGRRAGRQ